ncbi:hypothetical protein [Actinomadura rugatobispora]|uniref:Uncharacterized protein n=1 Tax=Actinomadura rugatobispora TaxID=1994 RepID=A0ABW1AFT4_9ACTN|nr:hypothetical protein GCM10010200_072410 [Actinomadura rugatobispora]
MRTEPVPGAEDLYPHVSQIDAPGDPMHGEPVMSPRVMGLLIAPSIPEFLEWWEGHKEAVSEGLAAGRCELPEEWQRGARRRSNELQAIYNSTDVLDILRGLHRDHGVFPTGALA